MKCPHCNYEDQGHISDDGKWVEADKREGEHFSVEVAEVSLKDDDQYPTCFTPELQATRGYGWLKESRSVHACASCGILFIVTQ